jgi:NADH-quinone oxidoreductase subunit N
MDTLTVVRNLQLIVPEIVLALTILAVIAYDVFLRLETSRRAAVVALVGLAIMLVCLIRQSSMPASEGFMQLVRVDAFGRFFKFLFVAVTALIILFSLRSSELGSYKAGEFYTILLTATLGMCFLVSSINFLMFYLAIETVSLPAYLLAGYLKRDRVSSEAGLKYILYGAVASGVMLFGISYLFGLSGSFSMTAALKVVSAHRLALVALLFVLVGLAFKMSLVPFHFWVPDVYQGAPTPITAYLAVASKAAGFGALFRFLLPLFRNGEFAHLFGGMTAMLDLRPLFWVLAVATMSVGNLVAIRQQDLKRLLAYSSIAHAGYITMGLAVMNARALEAMLFYFVAYLFMNLGAFLVAMILINKIGSALLEDYKGLVSQMPFLVVTMAIFLFSLTGIPPTVGFIAKFNLFYVLIAEGTWWYYSLALIGVGNAVISLYYYMRIVKAMVLERAEVERPLVRWSAADGLLLLILVVPVIVLGIYWSPLSRFVSAALQ